MVKDEMFLRPDNNQLVIPKLGQKKHAQTERSRGTRFWSPVS